MTFSHNKLSLVASKQAVVITIIALGIVNLNSLTLQTQAQEGKGEATLWDDDYRLNEYKSGAEADSLFRTSQPNSLDETLEQIVKKQRVDVVLAGSDLMKVMNIVSTKSRAMFLEDYDRFFKDLDIGSTSRPMLYTFLGLQFASQDQIEAWYRPSKSRVQSRVVESCRSLIRKHQSSVNLDEDEQFIVDKAKETTGNHFHLAYLVNKNNLNLFMLDSFLMLCSKIEGEKLADDLREVKIFV